MSDETIKKLIDLWAEAAENAERAESDEPGRLLSAWRQGQAETYRKCAADLRESFPRVDWTTDPDPPLDYAKRQLTLIREALKAGRPEAAKAYVLGALVQLNGGAHPDGGVVRDVAEMVIEPAATTREATR